MDRLFAVTRSRSVAWDDAKSMEEQADWPAHAAFMNALQVRGIVLLGGPLSGARDILLIMRAEDEQEITSCLSKDPWSRKEVLEIKTVAPWELRLGSLDLP